MFEINDIARNDIAGDADLCARRGWFYLNDKKYGLAQQQFEIALANDASNTRALMGAATVSWACQNWDGALYFFTRVLVIAPDFAEAYASRGAIFALTGDYSEALADLNTALRLDPNCVSAYINRASLNTSLHGYEAALEDLNHALILETSAPIQIKRAYVQFMLGRFEEAIEACTFAAMLEPTLGCTYYLRGLAHYNTGGYDAAVADFDMALTYATGSAEVYYARACAYQFLMEFELAAQNMEFAAHLDHTYQELAEQLRAEEAATQQPFYSTPAYLTASLA